MESQPQIPENFHLYVLCGMHSYTELSLKIHTGPARKASNKLSMKNKNTCHVNYQIS